MQLKRWMLWGVPIVLVAVAAWFGSRLLGRKDQSTTYTQVVTAGRGNLVATVTLTGEVSAERRVELSFDVNKIPLVELNVSPGQEVKQGTVLARIDPASLQRAVDQAEADLVSAEETLNETKNPVSELDRRKAELDVAQAEVALEDARQALDLLLNPDPAAASKALRLAEYNLESARLSLVVAQHSAAVGKTVRDLEYTVSWHERKLPDLESQLQYGKVEKATVDEEAQALAKAQIQLEAARSTATANLTDAEDKVTQAEEALAELQAGADSVTLAQARNRVAQAEYNLATAKESLGTITAGPDPKAVQLAQARYDSAKATLEDAQAALQAATMVAPFDGTVISVGAKVGDLVSSGTDVVTLADLSELQILAAVDETDISQVVVGLEATITFDAFPGRSFKGKVLEVPLEGALQQNVVTYDVPLSMELIEGVALKPGMTANLKIVVGRRDNALLVPVLAVRQGEDGDIVVVETSPNGPQVELPVELGLTDGTNVEVLSGLIEGDRVIAEYASTQQEGREFGFGPTNLGGQPVPGGPEIHIGP